MPKPTVPTVPAYWEGAEHAMLPPEVEAEFFDYMAWRGNKMSDEERTRKMGTPSNRYDTYLLWMSQFLIAKFAANAAKRATSYHEVGNVVIISSPTNVTAPSPYSMKKFTVGQRVIVSDLVHPCFGMTGRVILPGGSDVLAWIDLDEDLPANMPDYTKRVPGHDRRILMWLDQCETHA